MAQALLYSKLLTWLCIVASLLDTTIAKHQQNPLISPLSHQNQPLKGENQLYRVAIIGAGAAGSSAAYHLQRFALSNALLVNIVVYESSEYVGGRSTTINALNDSRYPTELGASIFVQENRILVDAAEEFDLTSLEADADRTKSSKHSVGIWDGKTFAYKFGNDDMSWLDMAKFILHYGLAPLKTQWLMKSTVAKFLTMYDEPIFPWRSLTETVAKVGLLDVVAVTGQQFLVANSIAKKFSREVIQASTRVNYGQNLGLIHGLETMVCMAAEGAMAIKGGNWKIFDKMIKSSHADLNLNTRVTQVERAADESYYNLALSEQSASGQDKIERGFDSVIIATPFQFSGLAVSPSLLKEPDEVPYVTLYATFLVSPHKLSPDFFSTDPSEDVPDMVLTTLPDGFDLGSSRQGVGPPGFWSISTLREVEVESSKQYLYKVFSPLPLNANFVSKILGFSQHSSDDEGCQSLDSLDKSHVSWTYEKKWQSYPFEYPRVTFEEMNLDGSGLWYTGGMDSFISTMETNALMGKNVAKLVADDLLARKQKSQSGVV